MVEQILIRSLPVGTKVAFRACAEQRNRSFDAEARDVLAKSLERDPVTIIDLVSMDEGADIEFDPERLGLTAREDAQTYHLRWFTPVIEVDLCGHATLATHF